MLSAALSILEELGNWIDRITTRGQLRKAKLEEASISFRSAITKTQIYIGDKLYGNASNRESEKELAQSWSEASRLTRSISPDLSEACYHQSIYWALPLDSPSKDEKTLLEELELLRTAATPYNLKITTIT